MDFSLHMRGKKSHNMTSLSKPGEDRWDKYPVLSTTSQETFGALGFGLVQSQQAAFCVSLHTVSSGMGRAEGLTFV